MKKTRFLALVLVVSIMLMGAGYAVWTDQLVVNEVVRTGEVSVIWVNGEDEDPATLYPYGQISVFKEAPYTGAGSFNHTNKFATFDVDYKNPKLVNVNVTDLYPGMMAKAELKLVNNSTMPVVLTDFVVDIDDRTDEELLDKLECRYSWIHKDKNNVEIDRWNGGPGATLDGFQDYLNIDNNLKGRVLYPGDYILFDNPESESSITVSLPTSIVNEDDVENKKAIFSIKANFEQYNGTHAFPYYDADPDDRR